MTIDNANGPLNANGVPLPAGDVKAIKNLGSIPAKLSDIDVRTVA